MVISAVLPVAACTGRSASSPTIRRRSVRAEHDGFTYVGAPVTPRFRAIRQPGEAVSVMLVVDDGQVAYGDCAAVQYSGVGGRDGLFDAARASNETERSAQVTAYIAMACGPAQVLANPGVGDDEGMMIVGNEMARVAALVAAGRPAAVRPARSSAV